MKKYRIWLFTLLILVALGYWGYKELTRALPGELFPEQKREHITDISEVQYNSNPPTSGSHFAVWAKKGVYDRIISDGYLIHSLEHGYIVINYDCERKFSIFNFQFSKTAYAEEEQASASGEVKPLTKLTVFATDKKSWITPDEEPGIEVELPDSFKTDECKSLVEKLEPFTKEWQRVVVVPRMNMDHPVALTAWRRLEWLDSFDKDKIEYFIKSYHNLGPEKTME